MHIDRDALYRLGELSELLGVSVRTLQRSIVAGDLKARRLGRAVFVRGADLLDLLPEAEAKPPAKRKRSKGG